MTRWLAWNSRPIRPQSSAMSGSVAAALRMIASTAPRRTLTIRELRAFSASWRTGSGSSTASWYHARIATGASPSSPRSSRFQRARSTPLFVAKATYTVLSATPASPAIAAMVVAE
jgi:hypothetical protein